jgi:hypothetical protein
MERRPRRNGFVEPPGSNHRNESEHQVSTGEEPEQDFEAASHDETGFETACRIKSSGRGRQDIVCAHGACDERQDRPDHGRERATHSSTGPSPTTAFGVVIH